MTNDDDWATFCEMMAAAGWVYSEASDNYDTHYSFRHRKTRRVLLMHEFWDNDVWRVWLEAGQTPPPF